MLKVWTASMQFFFGHFKHWALEDVPDSGFYQIMPDFHFVIAAIQSEEYFNFSIIIEWNLIEIRT